MILVILWLKWWLLTCGVVCVEETGPKLSWLAAFKRLFSGGIKRGAPTSDDHAKWFALKRPLKRYKCVVCGVYFWAWKKTGFCGKWECYRRLHEGK